MKLKLLALIASLGLLMSYLVIPVKADIGIAIGTVGNFSTFDTEGTELEGYGKTTNQPVIDTNAASISEDVDFPSFFIEVVGKQGFIGYSLGVEHVPDKAILGSKTRSETDIDASNTSGVSSTYTAKAEIEGHDTIYIETALYPLDWIALYAKGGYSRVKVKSLESISSGINSSAYGDETVSGGMYGAGFRIVTPIGIIFKLEHTRTHYGEVTLDSTTGNKNRIIAEPEQESTRLAIGYQF